MYLKIQFIQYLTIKKFILVLIILEIHISFEKAMDICKKEYKNNESLLKICDVEDSGYY